MYFDSETVPSFSSTFFNLKFKYINSYSYNVGLQKAVFDTRFDAANLSY